MHEINLARVDLNLLVLFASLVQTRSVTKSGHGLRLSQPAVSHALARLRQTFDDKLFLRSPKGFVLTPRAEALAGPVRATLAAIENMLAPNGFDPATTTRTFRIATSDVVGAAEAGV